MKHAVALALVATLLAPLSAAAAEAAPDRASTVSIRFTAKLEGATTRECSLEVTRGADGVGVLQAAVDQGCISSYHISGSRYAPPGPWPIAWPPSPKGHHWLRCIDAICDVHAAPGSMAPGTWWGVRWDEGRQPYWQWGLERYAASPGDAFVAELRGYS